MSYSGRKGQDFINYDNAIIILLSQCYVVISYVQGQAAVITSWSARKTKVGFDYL